jgi:hypothetical protein
MQARGARARVGDNLYAGGPATVVGPLKTPKELARETGLAERPYRERAQIRQSLAEETLDILLEASLIGGPNAHPYAGTYVAKVEGGNFAPCALAPSSLPKSSLPQGIARNST